MDRDELLESRRFLSAIGHWPKVPARSNPAKWLTGFREEDTAHAEALLESLVYFSTELTTKLTISLFHSLSNEVSGTHGTYEERKNKWRGFIENCLFTFPTGEKPNPTDSGHAFVRIARQELGIAESRVLYPEQVFQRLIKGDRRPVVIVDDFAGSGDQFLKTWCRNYELTDGSHSSFQALAAEEPVEAWYLPVVATSYAANKIGEKSEGVRVRAAHMLNAKYSAIHSESVLFPDHLRVTARQFIMRASAYAGVEPGDELGWHDLALAIAFEHSVPNATLPIVWAETDSWNALLRRS